MHYMFTYHHTLYLVLVFSMMPVVWIISGAFMMRHSNGPGKMIAMITHNSPKLGIFLFLLFLIVWPLNFWPFIYVYQGVITLCEKISNSWSMIKESWHASEDTY